MPLVGEEAWQAWALEIGGDQYSSSWDLDFPPTSAFIKLFLGQYFEFDDQSNVNIGLLNIRWRDSNGVDQTINFPAIDAINPAPVLVQFNPTMTHVTFGIQVRSAYGLLVWTLGYWA